MINQVQKQAARVTILDAVQLDEELHNILKSQILAALKYFPPWVVGQWDAEINSILKLVVWKMSVLQSHSTFGQHMLNLKYSKETFTHNKAHCLLLLKICEDYFKLYTQRTISSYHIRSLVHWIDVALDVSKLFNLLLFLRNGFHPTLEERILSLRPVSVSRGPRAIGYNYMTRELLWHGFIELLGFILPLINYQYIRKKFFQAITKREADVSKEEHIFTIYSRCAFCNESPILPLTINCSHVFCYYCLESNRLIDMKYECPVCYCTKETASQVVCKS